MEGAVAPCTEIAEQWNNVDLNKKENAKSYLRFVFQDLLEEETIESLWDEDEMLEKDAETHLLDAISKGFEIFDEVWKDVYYDEDAIQMGETSLLLDTLEKGDILREHGCEIGIKFSDEGTPYIEIIEEPEGYELSSGLMTNGIPRECIPEDVCWDGEKWYCRSGNQDHIDSNSNENVEEPLTEAHTADERVVLGLIKAYPCYSAEILYTEEYYRILDSAGIKQSELNADLERKMRIIRWLHQINIDIADHWTEGLLGESEVHRSGIWEEMGRLLRVKEDTWEDGDLAQAGKTEIVEVNSDRVVETNVCTMDAVTLKAVRPEENATVKSIDETTNCSLGMKHTFRSIGKPVRLIRGIPMSCIPKQVFWCAQTRRWYSHNTVTGEESYQMDLVDDETPTEHLEGYPEYTPLLLSSLDYEEILTAANITREELRMDLQRKMRVIKWMCEINEKVVREWISYGWQVFWTSKTDSDLWREMGEELAWREVEWRTSPKPDRVIKVYCDLDGVLVDFEQGVRELFNKELWEIPSEQLWSRLAETTDFYTNLSWTADGKVLWDRIKDLHPIILTGVPKGRWAETQKKQWVRRELGSWITTITCHSEDKFEGLTDRDRGDILIDDRAAVGQAWTEAGGTFVWHKNTHDTIQQLKKLGVIEYCISEMGGMPSNCWDDHYSDKQSTEESDSDVDWRVDRL